MSTVLEPLLLDAAPALELRLELLPQALSAATVPKTRHPLMTLTRKLTFLLLMSIRAPEWPGGGQSSGAAGSQQVRRRFPHPERASLTKAQRPAIRGRASGASAAATVVQAAPDPKS